MQQQGIRMPWVTKCKDDTSTLRTQCRGTQTYRPRTAGSHQHIFSMFPTTCGSWSPYILYHCICMFTVHQKCATRDRGHALEKPVTASLHCAEKHIQFSVKLDAGKHNYLEERCAWKHSGQPNTYSCITENLLMDNRFDVYKVGFRNAAKTKCLDRVKMKYLRYIFLNCFVT